MQVGPDDYFCPAGQGRQEDPREARQSATGAGESVMGVLKTWCVSLLTEETARGRMEQFED